MGVGTSLKMGRVSSSPARPPPGHLGRAGHPAGHGDRRAARRGGRRGGRPWAAKLALGLSLF